MKAKVQNGAIRWSILAVSVLVVAINLRGQELPADLQNKRGKLPKEVVARSTDLPSPAGTVTKPPMARVEIVKDTYFGETMDDPYRWMENDNDPGWLPFLKKRRTIIRARCWISCRAARRC